MGWDTRWATYSEPNDVNVYPHYSFYQKLAIIHNGIIEDYAAIKQALLKKGHAFTSVTDTGVAGAYAHAGPEIGVASTMAFTTQVTVLAMMALAAVKRKDQRDDSSVTSSTGV